jgi:general secretion pathway protein J
MKRPLHGFTLLEMLIGLTLIGFILVLLFAAFGMASRSWDATESKLDRTSRALAARQFLRQTLANTRARYFAQPGKKQIAFVGAPDGMRFVSQLPTQFEGGGPKMMSLTVGGDQDRQDLVFRQAFLRPDVQDFSMLDAVADEQARVLMAGVKGIVFEYFGAQKPNEPAAWHTDWQAADQLPRLVRLRVDYGDDGKWPDLIAPIFLVDVDALCPNNIFPVPDHCVR